MKYFVLLSLVFAVFAGDVEVDLTGFTGQLEELNAMLDAKIQKQYDDIATCIADLLNTEKDLETIINDVKSGKIAQALADFVTGEADIKKAIADCQQVTGTTDELELHPINCIKDLKNDATLITTVIGDLKDLSLSGIKKLIQDGLTLEKDIELTKTDCE